MNQLIRILAAVVFVGVLSGCGGGGDGGATDVVYSGSTSAAIVKATNAGKLISDVLGGAETAGQVVSGTKIANATAPRRTGVAEVARRLNSVFRATAQQGSQRSSGSIAVAVINVDDVTPCDTGAVHTAGVLNDSGIGTLNIDYNDCVTDGETLNGAATLSVAAFDFANNMPADFTTQFTRLTFTGSGVDVAIGGSIHASIKTKTNTETLTVNVVIQDNVAQAETQTENLVIVDVFDFILFPNRFNETIDGRLFDSVLGFVDVTTPAPLSFNSIDQQFPDGGLLRLVGAANGGILVTPASATSTKIELDTDGDNVADTIAALRWTELETAASADLGDADGDGMHNSWETVHGFDPSNPADGSTDDDNDGFSNFDEYRAGTDPRDTTSVPPTADVTISMFDSVDPAPTGRNFTYSLFVSNSGPNVANHIRVQDTLPVGTAFVSASGAQWNCNYASGVVTCTSDSLAVGTGSSIEIVVMPPAEVGTISNTAAVSSDSLDPNGANDKATEQTEIVSASAELAISMTGTLAVVAADNAVYRISVSNVGPLDAPNTMLTETLPNGSTLVSVTPSQGSCSGAGPVVCNLGTLLKGDIAMVTLVAAPFAQGIVQSTASVASDVADIDASNNSATATTAVGQTITPIQTLVDSAAPGSTIRVDPGVYVGKLNFNGKDVSLQSRDGPTNTLISGITDTAIQIGPGGAIRGFTITHTNTSFGTVAVSGAGTDISGNIFDGNISQVGGSGAAILGNVASPTIEGNIFRNNSCDTQFAAGVVVFFNDSSPLIANNVFSNNPCNAINLEVQTAQVINNTFVGNRTAVDLDFSKPTQVYRNNLIVQNGVGWSMLLSPDTPSPVWENNLVFGNTTDYLGSAPRTGINGNISADPLFLDAAAGDYRLQSGSPAIDAGASTGAPANDFDGSVRPFDGDGDGLPVVDIGAFEFH